LTATSRPRTAATRAAAITGAALAAVQGSEALGSFGRANHVGLVLSFCAVAGAAAAARLWWTGCFESKLFTALLALFAITGEVLRAAAGWPGDPAADWTRYGVLVAVLAPAALALAGSAIVRPGGSGTSL
jgi:hypothetical protein